MFVSKWRIIEALDTKTTRIVYLETGINWYYFQSWCINYFVTFLASVWNLVAFIAFAQKDYIFFCHITISDIKGKCSKDHFLLPLIYCQAFYNFYLIVMIKVLASAVFSSVFFSMHPPEMSLKESRVFI